MRANLINFKPLMIVLPLVDTFAAWYSALLQAVSLYLCVCVSVYVRVCVSFQASLSVKVCQIRFDLQVSGGGGDDRTV